MMVGVSRVSWFSMMSEFINMMVAEFQHDGDKKSVQSASSIIEPAGLFSTTVSVGNSVGIKTKTLDLYSASGLLCTAYDLVTLSACS